MNGKVFTLTTDHVEIQCNFSGDADRYAAVGPHDGLLVALDTQLDAQLVSEGHARNFVSRVQALRKDAHLEASDVVQVYYDVPEGSELSKVLSNHFDYVATALRSKLHAGAPAAAAGEPVVTASYEGKTQVAGTSFTLTLTR